MKTLKFYVICIVMACLSFSNTAEVNAQETLPDTEEQWQPIYETDKKFSGVWGTGDKIFIVGERGTIIKCSKDVDASYVCEPMQSSASSTLNGIWGSSENNIFAVDINGVFHHYVDKWAKASEETLHIFKNIWGATANDIFAVSLNGGIVYYNGGINRSETFDNSTVLMSVWGSALNDVFAVGNTILHFDGTVWTPMEAISESFMLRSVWGTSGYNIYAVGNSGLILYYDGTEWKKEESGTSENLIGLWGASEYVYAVSDTGKIYQRSLDGKWNDYISDSPFTNPEQTIEQIWKDPESNLVIAVGNGTVFSIEISGFCPGGVCYVSKENGSDVDGNGSYENPFESIQRGIDNVMTGGSVVARGEAYSLTDPLDFNGKIITVQSEKGAESCTIDCSGSGKGFYFHNGETSNAVLAGFTIKNASEGGIYVKNGDDGASSSPTIENCILTENKIGIYTESSSPTIHACIIENNTLDSGNGAGIYCVSSSPTIKNSTIRNNTVTNGNGGGIFCEAASSPIIRNSFITNNTADNGGGIYCDASSAELINNTISGNTATVNGGGLFCANGSSPIISNSILWNDTPQEIYFQSDGTSNTLTVEYSDIQGGESGIATNSNGTVTWADTNLDAEPLFADAANGDFTLQPVSPCINAGNCQADESCIYTGDALDIGASEHNGSVLSYTFDNALTDANGFGNDATSKEASNDGTATFTTDRFGKPSAAYQLDGTDDWISISGLNPDFTESGFTVNVWFKPNAIKLGRQVICWLENNQPSISIEGDKLYFGFSSDPAESPFIAENSVSIGTWYMVSYTYSSANNNTLKFYLNGKSIGEKTLDSGFVKSPSDEIRLGIDETTTNYFTGVIDDFQIYNRALSAGEIYSLSTGLSGYWDFDETKEQTAIDTTGNHHATVYECSTDAGVYGKSLNFKGYNKRVQLPGKMTDYISENFTISMWIKVFSLKTIQYLFYALDDSPGIKLYGDNRVGFAFKPNDDSISLEEQSAGFTSPDPISKGVWVNIACTWNGSIFAGYINGEKIGEASLTPPFSLGEGILIGSDGIANKSFEGLIDDLRIYTRVLSEDELRVLGTGLVGHWKFEDEKIKDSSGNQRTGDIQGVTWQEESDWVSDKAFDIKNKETEDDGSEAINLTGQNHVVIPDDGSLSFTGSMTAGLWVKLTDTSVPSPLIYKAADVNENMNYSLGFESEKFFFHMKKKNSADGTDYTVFSVTKPMIDTWYYVAGGYDGEKISLYVMGKLEGSLTTGIFVPCTGSGNLVLGTDFSNDSNAVIDEVRIYNRALSDSELQRLGGILYVDLEYTGEEKTGYKETPYTTIGDAIAHATPGSVICIAKSEEEYKESLIIADIQRIKLEGGWNNYSGIWRQDSQINPNDVMVTAEDNTTSTVTIENAPDTIIEGFTFDKGMYASNSDRLLFIKNVCAGSKPVQIESCQDVIIEDNRIFGESGSTFSDPDATICNVAVSTVVSCEFLTGEDAKNCTALIKCSDPAYTVIDYNKGYGVILKDATVTLSRNLIRSDFIGIKYDSSSGGPILENTIHISNMLVPESDTAETEEPCSETTETVSPVPDLIVGYGIILEAPPAENTVRDDYPIQIEDNVFYLEGTALVGIREMGKGAKPATLINNAFNGTKDVVLYHYVNTDETEGDIMSCGKEQNDGVPYIGNPIISSVLPGNLATGIPVDSPITITFSEPMNVPSLTAAGNITITGSCHGDYSAASPTYDHDSSLLTLALAEGEEFISEETVEVVITGVVETEVNGPLGQDYKWSFTIEQSDRPDCKSQLNSDETLEGIGTREKNSYTQIEFHKCGDPNKDGCVLRPECECVLTDVGCSDTIPEDCCYPCIDIIIIPQSFSKIDEDGDGMSDDWERYYFGDTETSDQTTDSDDDGLLDLDEYLNNIIPTAWDTDGDGMRDGWEVFCGETDKGKACLADKGLDIDSRKICYCDKIDPRGNDASQDPDNDGYNNLHEHNAETLPIDGASYPAFEPDSGIFKVGPKGIVTINWIFDGGGYEGEVGIFIIKGMENFAADLKDFIKEAARRALSNSSEGYVVFSDRKEGAQFTGDVLGEENQNYGRYNGIKKFEMDSEDQFAIILVPNGTLQEIFDDPSIKDEETSKHPFFSFPSANSDYGTHMSRISDINGAGIAFVFEDMSFVQGDSDYNDLVFQIGETVGDSPIFISLIDKEIGEIPTVPEKIRQAIYSDPLGKKILDQLDAQTPADENPLWMSVVTDCPVDLLMYNGTEEVTGKEGGDITGAVFRTDETTGEQIISWAIGFKITERTLKNLKDFSEENILKLRGMKNSEYNKEADFTADVKKVIGSDAFTTHNTKILSHAKRFRISEKTLENLTDVGLSQYVISKLGNLKDREYKDESKFYKDLERTIGKENAALYGSLIQNQVEVIYRIVQQSLNGLKDKDVDDDTLLKLRGLKDQVYIKKDAFKTDLTKFIGEITEEQYKVLMEHVEQSHCLIDQTLDKLKTEEGLLDENINALAKVINREYSTEADFIRGIGAEQVREHMPAILCYAQSCGYRYRIVQETLDQLKNEGISEEILTELETVKDVEFLKKDDFIAYLMESEFMKELILTVGPESVEKYQSLILKYAEHLYCLTQEYLDQLSLEVALDPETCEVLTDGDMLPEQLNLPVPEDILNILATEMTDVTYPTEAQFIIAVEIAIGNAKVGTYKDVILKYAKDGKYRFVLQGKEDTDCTVTVKQFEGETETTSEAQSIPVKIEAHRATRLNMTVSSEDFKYVIEDPNNCIDLECVPFMSIPYDFNGDGVVDIQDIMKVASQWDMREGNQEYDWMYDIDGDKRIDIGDIMQVVACYNKICE